VIVVASSRNPPRLVGYALLALLLALLVGPTVLVLAWSWGRTELQRMDLGKLAILACLDAALAWVVWSALRELVEGWPQLVVVGAAIGPMVALIWAWLDAREQR
jgi:hypothetical protein